MQHTIENQDGGAVSDQRNHFIVELNIKEMSSTARKERRHLWWKQHARQVSDDDKGTLQKPRAFKTLPHKRNLNARKEQPTSSPVSHSPQSEENKARFIVFVGNLPFDLTKEDVIHHFRCTGEITDFRLMTKKDGGTSKGCGFLELENAISYQKALNLHHSVIGGRKVNVEVTCGGGGSGEKRLEKLNEKKKKFRKRRGKQSIKREKEENAETQSNTTVDINQTKMTESDTVIKKEKNKTVKESDQNEINKTKEKTDGKQTEKEKKKRKRKHELAEERVKKKSLSESSAMESVVKDLELDSLVIKKKKKKQTND